MSIPKEPRQLMINIMYLVLTALLALNVSAEIFNAFEMVDEGLKSANTSLDASNEIMPSAIREQAKATKEAAKYADRIDGIRALSKESTDYIDAIVDELIDESGVIDGKVDDNDYVIIKGGKRELRGKKNYDGTTRIMVDGGKGEELKEKMKEIKAKFLEFADEEDRAGLVASIPIAIDEEAWKNSPNEKKNWADFTFGHMPLGATMPIFSKFKNDIKASEAELLNYLAEKVGVGGATLTFDKYAVVSAPEKSYIINNETYKSELFLSAAAGGSSNTGISISVNGKNLRMNNEGKAVYETKATGVGVKKYTAVARITDPVTGKVDTYKKEFEYEVGERSVAISASKMNVFYIGVDNPVEISAAGVASNKVKVSMDGGSIKRNGDGTYTVTATTPSNNAKVNVSAEGLNASKVFRVKRIPDPVPKLSKKRGGVMSPGEFKAQPGVLPVLENFDFDTKCTIKGFRMVRVAPRSDAEISNNNGGKYNGNSTKLRDKARPGDRYFFEEIKCQCPGDKGPRNLGGMNFMIR